MAKKLVCDPIELRKLCEEAGSMMEAARRLKLHFNTFKKLAKEAGCYKPSTAARSSIPKMTKMTKEYVIDRYLSNKQYVRLPSLRKYLINFGFKEAKCEVCGLSEWLGKPIPLELHHKNGDHYNNHLENLEILCPTCHAQKTNGSNNPSSSKYAPSLMPESTANIAVPESVGVLATAERSPKQPELVVVTCCKCLKSFSVSASAARTRKYCSRACFYAGRPPAIAKDKLLSVLAKSISYTETGKLLGISRERVRSLCVRFNLLQEAKAVFETNKKLNKENRKKNTATGTCVVCGSTFSITRRSAVARKYCSYVCAHTASVRFSLTKEQLLELLRNDPNYTHVGHLFGVSGTAIKKRCKKFDIFDQVDALVKAEKRRNGLWAVHNTHNAASRKKSSETRRANLPDFVAYQIACPGEELQLMEVHRFHTREELVAAGFNYTLVCKACRRERKSYKGYIWQREDKSRQKRCFNAAIESECLL